MKEFSQQLKWQFILLTRNNIMLISVVVTLIYGGLFYLIKDLGNTDKLLTLFVINDPVIIGLFFLGVSVLIEKRQQVIPAIFVSPANLHVYLLSRILALSLIGWACSLGMGLAALGFNFDLLHFSLGVFGICTLFCMIGAIVVSYSEEVLIFLLKCIPIMLLIGVPPLLNYFGISDQVLFNFSPLHSALQLISNSYSSDPIQSEILTGYGTLVLWNVFAYWLAYRSFKSQVINN